jgi:beta-phosphoglucomutase-like phosphatase (HAD superfamily)
VIDQRGALRRRGGGFGRTVAVDSRAAIVGAIVLALVTWLLRRFGSIPLPLAVALFVAAVALAFVYLRRKRVLQERVAEVLSEESSSDSALKMLALVADLLRSGMDVPSVQQLVDAIVANRRHPHESLAALALNNSDGAAEVIAGRCDSTLERIHIDRRRTDAEAQEALRIVARDPNSVLLVYGYSRTVCEAIAALRRPAAQILVLEDRQYGRTGDAEHVHVLNALHRAGLVAGLVGFRDLDRLLNRDAVLMPLGLDRDLHLMANRTVISILGCDAFDQHGGALVPGEAAGKPSDTALLVDAMTKTSAGSLVERRLIVIAEQFKLVADIEALDARSGAPVQMTLSNRALHWLGLAVPASLAPIRLKAIAPGSADICTTVGYFEAGALRSGDRIPAWSGIDENSTRSSDPVQATADLLVLDWNGVVVLDEGAHEQAFQQLTKDCGHQLSHELYESRCKGRTDEEGIEALRQLGLLFGDLDDLVANKRDLYRAQLPNGPPLSPGVVSLLERARDSGCLVWILSASSPATIQAVIQRSALRGLLQPDRVSGGVGHGERAAQLREVLTNTGSDPARCVYLDDRQEGLDAVKAVGISGHLIDPASPAPFNEVARTVRFAGHWSNV